MFIFTMIYFKISGAILSVVGDVPINSEASVMTSSLPA
jgi:hypothetical protein